MCVCRFENQINSLNFKTEYSFFQSVFVLLIIVVERILPFRIKNPYKSKGKSILIDLSDWKIVKFATTENSEFSIHDRVCVY